MVISCRINVFRQERDSGRPFAVGETVSLFAPSFNGSVQVEARPDRTSSDAGALAAREVLERSGVIDWLGSQLIDPRNPLLIQHSLSSQLRTIILQRVQGWIDQSDTDALRDDPVLALACSDRRGTAPLEHARPSQPTLSRMAKAIAVETNRSLVHEGLLRLVAWRLGQEPQRRRQLMTLDIDGLPIEVFGSQAGSAYNVYAGKRIYYPMIASIAETGDLIGALLREGQAGPAAEADNWIPALVERMRELGICRQVQVRIDAGFTGGPTLSALEAAKLRYVGRLTSNTALQRLAAPLLRRPPGRRPMEPREWTHELVYQAESWDEPRRVVLVVQERPDDLFLDHFFLVTNFTEARRDGDQLLALYRRRGKAEAHMGELKSVLTPHLSSTCRGNSTYEQVFARNEANLLLSVYAYQVMHAMRRALERKMKQGISLRRLRERYLKVAATVRVHARRVTVVIAQSAAELWQVMTRLLDRMPVMVW